MVPVLTSEAPDPYVGFNVHLALDGTLLAAAGAAEGDALQGLGASLCIFVKGGDLGAGAMLSCAAEEPEGTTSAGTLATFTLVPSVASGCAVLHIFTPGPPDDGGQTFGSFTLSPDATPQVNTYGPDLSVDLATGATGCAGDATQTPTPTGTALVATLTAEAQTALAATQTALAGQTSTATPTITPTPAITVTPTPTPVPTATNTPVLG